jgi:methylthioribose-1-phosphate isomerase
MNFRTISFKNGKLKLLDQNALPSRLKYITCKSESCVLKAIKKMNIRGAPLIGVAAAFGVALSALNAKDRDQKVFLKRVYNSLDMLAASRPTAVNLFYSLQRMKKILDEVKNKPVFYIRKYLLSEAKKILKEDKDGCLKIAEKGSVLIKDGDSILTHCNAGALATSGIGTALGIIYYANSQGKKLKIYVDETRPKLQGARLSCWELQRNGLDPILICDSVAATLMKEKKIKKILVGADRIALNGDVANKIGTYHLAVLAKNHKIPFFVAAPVSTIDFDIRSGKQIPIEVRSRYEVVNIGNKGVVPKGIRVYNPVFDITPHRLVSAIITEKGIIRPPFKDKLKKLK